MIQGLRTNVDQIDPVLDRSDPAGTRVRRRLLVVDDEPLILWSLKSGLADAFDVTTAASPKDAVDLLRTHPFDALLTDLLMDDMDGFDLAAQARRLQPGIRTFLMTAYGSRDTLRNAVRCGFCGCIEKPFPIQQAREILSRCDGEPDGGEGGPT